MKSNPAVPGGSSKSKPTWSNTSGCSTTSAFFRGGAVAISTVSRNGSGPEKAKWFLTPLVEIHLGTIYRIVSGAVWRIVIHQACPLAFGIFAAHAEIE